MSKFNIWMATHIHNRIQKYKKYRDKLNRWIERDRLTRQEYLTKLDTEEYLLFGYKTGYIAKDKKKR